MLNNLLKYPAILICCFIVSICNVSQADQRVSAIQNMLKNQGYDVGAIDGKVGKNTLREIKNWQFLNGYSESGKIDENQINTLRQQSYEGKKLNNKEMERITKSEERRKREELERELAEIKIQKKEEKDLIINTVIFLGVVIGFILIIIGEFMKSIATPKKDRRFRTGYENNASVNEGLYDNGESLQNIGGLMLIGAIIFAIIG